MSSKLRLFSSLALGVTAAASAHAQALGSDYGYAGITITSTTGVIDTYFLGASVLHVGYYGFGGSVHNGNYEAFSLNGTYSQAFGYTFASPNGEMSSGLLVKDSVEIVNPNSFYVGTYFRGFTSSSAAASQDGVGDEAYGIGYAELAIGSVPGYGSFVFQESAAKAVADDLNGFGNYTAVYRFNSYHGGHGTNHFYGFGSPYNLTASYSQTYNWSLFLAPYSYAYLTSIVYETHGATSLRSSSVPGPAAVAPFAVGFLGTLRRRSRKR